MRKHTLGRGGSNEILRDMVRVNKASDYHLMRTSCAGLI